jgi:hypothetical protein
MKFLIDTQQDTLRKRMESSDLILGQLLTPLTRYKNWGGTYAIDNGAFSGFDAEAFRRLLERNADNFSRCLFVTVPDIVGSAQRTLELFARRSMWIPDVWPVALVAQDGIEDLEIPWDELQAVFIGGMDPWKDSRHVVDVVKVAKLLGKWVHVGRVNSPKRFEKFEELGCDSCDGSGIAMYDHMLEKIHRRREPEVTLFDDELKETVL